MLKREIGACLLAALLAGWSAPVLAAENPVVACAIRWDAWYTNGAKDPAHDTAVTLSKPQWHDRAPLHAKFDAKGMITWTPTQATFDAEIRAAHDAGLCWTYLAYGKDGVIDPGDSMMRGLAFHRSSSIGSAVDYALTIPAHLLGPGRDYARSIGAIIDVMQDANYQRLTIAGAKRPLLFFFYDSGEVGSNFGGNLGAVKDRLDLLRKVSIERHLGNPYIVILASPADTAETVRKAVNGDAISEYIAGTRNGHPMTWAQFEPSIENDWRRYAAATAADVVPTLRSGADIRARCQTPGPWEHRFKPGDLCQNYTSNPSNAELRHEFLAARAWVNANRAKDPARLMLVYAWSECDESGNCLMPTYGDPTGQKLRVISDVIH